MRDTRLRESLPGLIAKLFRQVARVHNRALKGFELSAVQAHVLSVLWIQGPMTIGELQAILALGSSTLTGTIDRMERAGLVRREAVEGDRRAWRIEPVAWPAARRDKVLMALAETEDECFAELKAAERRELVRLLEKAIASIERVDREGRDD